MASDHHTNGHATVATASRHPHSHSTPPGNLQQQRQPSQQELEAAQQLVVHSQGAYPVSPQDMQASRSIPQQVATDGHHARNFPSDNNVQRSPRLEQGGNDPNSPSYSTPSHESSTVDQRASPGASHILGAQMCR
jgi:hypothetical protein